VRQPAHHGTDRYALVATPTTPLIRLDDPAGEHRPAGLKPLPRHHQAELIDTAERGQVGTAEGSVGHVEVFQMDS